MISGPSLAEPVGSRSGRISGAPVWQSQLPLEDTRCPSGQDPSLLDQVQLYLVDQVQREWATGLSEAQVLDLVQYMKLDQVQLLHLRARSNRIKKRPTFLVDPFFLSAREGDQARSESSSQRSSYSSRREETSP